MKIKSAKSFRTWFKTEYKKKKKEDSSYDENFIGTYYDFGEDRINGFYELFHGDKPNIANDLMDGLKNAQDSQAIYEFIQNAADCDSDYFAVYYNDDYFLAINNGSSFTTNDLRSILNANQSTKTNNEGQAIDCSKIGRFGIGFKLVHRLVGENDGKNELVQDYKGPILFSWTKKEQLDSLIQINSPNEIEYVDEISSNYPSLFKILLTNFPTQPLEKIKDISYEEKCLFSENELFDFIDYLKLTSLNFDFTKLSEGSLFFLRLGKGKSELLNDNLFHLDKGIANSLNFLNKLNKVELGFKNVIEKLPIRLISFEIKPEEIKNPEDEYCHAKIIFGYFPSYKEGITNFKGSPNFYKYFPLSKESHGLNFILHSTAFRIKTDRTQFEEDTNSTNTSLFNIFWNKFKVELEKIKANNIQDFKAIYSNLLISKPLVDENGNKKWFYNSFYEPLLDFLRLNIPTKDGFSANKDNVKIKKLKQQLNLSDFGLNHIEWFEWDDDADNLLIDEAIKTDKLGIKEWTIRDIIENSEIGKINNWINSLDDETYLKFLNELNEVGLKIETRIKLINIKLFKFSDNKFYTLKEITGYDIRRFEGQSGNYLYKKTDEPLSLFLFHTHKTENIGAELQKLGFCTCDSEYSKFIKLFFKDGWNVYYFDSVLDDLTIYLNIAEKCKTNVLTPEEKRRLFLNLTNESTKFDKVGDDTLKKIHLFCDSQGNIKPLTELIGRSYSTYSWLNPFMIKFEEFFFELNTFLIPQDKLFDKIILPNIEIIKDDLSEVNGINELVNVHKENHRSFFNEFIIQKKINGFEIIDKSDNYQIIPSKDEKKIFVNFIESFFSNKFNVLPHEFSHFNDQDGILKGEKLHSLILELVDIDEHKDTLAEIIQYNDPSLKFLNKISEFRFNSDVSYSKEDFEFKILDLACEKLKESDFSMFRDKVVIEKAGRSFYFSDIPKNTDSIKFESKEFSLSKLFPSTHENSNLLSDLIIQFSLLGISKEKLITLIGLNEKFNETDIFKKIVSQNRENRKNKENKRFENPEQFLYFIYFLKFCRNFGLDTLNHLVYPSEFALKKEALPNYVIEWVNQYKINILDFEKVGVHTETSTLVSLRRFFLSKTDFNLNKIAEKLSSNETLLLNTLELLKEKNIELKNDNEFSVFKEIVRVINSSREKEQELKIQEVYNSDTLEEKSIEWKTINDFSIYLYKGSLPKFVKLDVFEDYIFYKYNETDFVVTGNKIYLNETTDRNKVLMEVATFLNDNNFTLSVFGGRTDETETLKQELEKLKQQLAQNNGATLETGFNTDISKNDQKEANREAKVIVKEKLESEGFEFTNGIDEFSTINGVKKEGIEYPLVVKSYKNQDEPLKIGANEWIQLMHPNSMFWVYFGNDKIACLKLNELLRKQDNLTISFSTENLDVENRLEKFAVLLRYFGDVHFDFHSVKPNNYSTATVMGNYQFDERKTEEDLSSDDQDIL